MEIHSTKGVIFPNGLAKVVGSQNHSHITMNTNHPLHMQPESQSPSSSYKPESKQDFMGILNNALRNVEKLENNTNQLTTRAVHSPDKVEAHQVLLAAEKSRFALNFTKTIADNLVRSFRELSSPR